MYAVLNAAAVIFTIVSIIGVLCLIYVAKRTKNLTDFLSVCDWFGRYIKISQRVQNKEAVRAIREQYKHLPISEQIREYRRLFEADFAKLFDKLDSNGKHYRVVTHYKKIMNDAQKDGLITYISEPVPIEKKRMLHELRPLIGWSDYRKIKRCIRKHPQKMRCCAVCCEYDKCQCERGGSCLKVSKKRFVRYDFIVNKK